MNPSALDEAILANRACPCEMHAEAVLAEMRKRNTRFMQEQTEDFQRRTHD